MSHLSDLVPDEANEGHYLKFSDPFGTETTKFICNLLNIRNKNIRWVLQHLTCLEHRPGNYLSECDKPRLVYTHKKPHNILGIFKQITSDFLFTCSTTVPELKSCITLLGTMSEVVTVGQKENLSQISIAIQFALCVNVKTRNK